jgi:hypothetical protein
MQPEDDWKARVLMTTMDARMQYTMYSALWRQMLGKTKAGILPRIIGQGWITESGAVYCTCVNREGVLLTAHRLTSAVVDFRDAWRLVADAAELTDSERQEMFKLIRQWIGRDSRVKAPLSAADQPGMQ